MAVITWPIDRISFIIIGVSSITAGLIEEKGSWSHEAIIAVKLKAREKMIDHALGQKIIYKASNKTKAVMENFLHAAGFKIVLFF